MIFRTRNTFNLALGAALAARQPTLLCHLVNSHGHRLSAEVLATWPKHQVADLLSILPRTEQLAIYLRLPFGTRTGLTQMGLPRTPSDAGSLKVSIFGRFRAWLLRSRPSVAITGRGPGAQDSSAPH